MDAARTVPRLHLVTDDRVLARDGFPAEARGALEAGGADLALHLRAPSASARFLYRRARDLADVTGGDAGGRAGPVLVVNDRLDVALAAGAHGAQVGDRGLPVSRARAVLGRQRLLGASVHGVEAARIAARDGADFLLVGTIYPTASHPGRPGAGPGLLRDVGLALSGLARSGDEENGVRGPAGARVVAIGGVTLGRIPEVTAAGAFGVAVIREVWERPDPAAAVRDLLEVLDREARPGRGEP